MELTKPNGRRPLERDSVFSSFFSREVPLTSIIIDHDVVPIPLSDFIYR